IVFRHWPLPYHKFAYQAAKAAECAGQQGTFESFHDLVYKKADSLGLKTFHAFAVDAGIRDTVRFDACLDDPKPSGAVEQDIAAARALGAIGTPALVINGMFFSRAPD